MFQYYVQMAWIVKFYFEQGGIYNNLVFNNITGNNNKLAENYACLDQRNSLGFFAGKYIIADFKFIIYFIQIFSF